MCSKKKPRRLQTTSITVSSKEAWRLFWLLTRCYDKKSIGSNPVQKECDVCF